MNPSGPAKQVDAGGNDRRADAGIVEHQRLDEVIGVAAVIRGVDEAMALAASTALRDVLANALDFSQNRVKRIFERAIQFISLRRAQFLEVT